MSGREAGLGSRDDFHQLAEHFEGVVVWTVSAEGGFDHLSGGFEDIWGVPPEEVLDDLSVLLASVHPDDRALVEDLMGQRPEEVEEETVEHRVVRPDGTVRWVEVTQVPIRGEDGELEEVVGITTDVTERKRRELELEVLNRVLRHDVRNDLSVALGWLEVVEEHVDDEEGRDALERVRRAGEHVVELTEVARDYADVVLDADVVTPEPTPLAPVLRRELETRRDAYPDAEFTVEGAIPEVTVAGNKLLGTVFRNLLNNAVQHNDAARPTVTVSVEAGDDAVTVDVSDDGPGVPPELRDSLFGRGEHGLDSPGTGMGLYLSESVVSGVGGTIELRESEGRGATFRVELPRA